MEAEITGFSGRPGVVDRVGSRAIRRRIIPNEASKWGQVN